MDAPSFPLGLAMCAGTGLVFLLMFPITYALEARRLRKVTATFLKDRPAMSDEEFLRRLAAEPEAAAFYLAGRRAMAELSGVPAETVHPKDTVRSLLMIAPGVSFGANSPTHRENSTL